MYAVDNCDIYCDVDHDYNDIPEMRKSLIYTAIKSDDGNDMKEMLQCLAISISNDDDNDNNWITKSLAFCVSKMTMITITRRENRLATAGLKKKAVKRINKTKKSLTYCGINDDENDSE